MLDKRASLPRPKRASAVKDRENLGRVAPETIHDSVAVHDYLPKRWLPNLGNDAAGAWVVLEAADGRDDSFDDQVRVVRRGEYGWRERLRALAAPRRYGSPNEAALDLIVIDALAVVHFGQPAVDLCQEHEALDSVIERGISGKLLESCENSLFDRARRSCCAARCSLAHGESLRFQTHSRQMRPYGYRYAIVAIRQAARPERRSISDTHEVEGAAT